jgi:hypothetical protein
MSGAMLAPKWPDAGYLPTSLRSDVMPQRKQQLAEVSEACILARAEGKPAPCAQVLNISLFFDGTNNHNESDSAANPRNTSNIARLYHASIQDDAARSNGYYSYYINGVGTEFKEIGEMKPSEGGLAFAAGGDQRILWGLTRLVHAVQLALSGQQDVLKDPEAKALVDRMEYTRYKTVNDREVVSNALKKDRQEVMNEAMQPLLEKIKQPYKPEIRKIKLFVYGFSRGAAEARVFVGRLEELCTEEGGGKLFYGLPISVEFLGLMDTVASVGVAGISGGAEGHMGWADGTLALAADLSFLKQTAHLVSAHEQRLCFPLDSIRLKNGSYPQSTMGEWVYPGVHSDVGGGYPPGDQGKAPKSQGMLLSQMPLHHLYSLAFKAGAPLRVQTAKLSDLKQVAGTDLDIFQHEPWREMDPDTVKEFEIDAELIQRYNAWVAQAKTASTVADILEYQSAQITAWRIERYAGGPNGLGPGQADCTYYKQSEDAPAWVRKKQNDAWKKQSKATKNAQSGKPVELNDPEGKAAPVSYTPNLSKTYEPTMDQTQLRDGADDFSDDYFDRVSFKVGNLEGMMASVFLMFPRIFSEDCGQERVTMRHAGTELYSSVIGDEKLMALYDNHVHDSRAWFMHSALAKREPGGSYLRYRTIYFTDGIHNKEQYCKMPSKPDAVFGPARMRSVNNLGLNSSSSP